MSRYRGRHLRASTALIIITLFAGEGRTFVVVAVGQQLSADEHHHSPGDAIAAPAIGWNAHDPNLPGRVSYVVGVSGNNVSFTRRSHA